MLIPVIGLSFSILCFVYAGAVQNRFLQQQINDLKEIVAELKSAGGVHN